MRRPARADVEAGRGHPRGLPLLEIPFTKTKANHPAVHAPAAHLGCTSASVARKFGNFGSFDPTLAERNVVGLGHASKTDRLLWEWYSADWSLLVDEAVVLWSGIVTDPAPADSQGEEILIRDEQTEALRFLPVSRKRNA